MSEVELKELIHCIHRLFYSDDILDNPKRFLEFHKHLGELFNYADITETLCENNPREVTPNQVEHAIKQGWMK